MRLKTLLVATSLTAIIGCGTSDKNEKNAESQDVRETRLSAAQEAEKAKYAQDLPKGTILIAELDSEGKVIGSQMRTVDVSVEGKSKEELIRLFSEQGQPIENLLSDDNAELSDNLDEKSTQQFWGKWKHRRGYRCGAWNYCNYRPRCNYQGYSYSYGYQQQSSVQYQAAGYIPAYHMPYNTYQDFRVGYGASGAIGGVGYQPYYSGGMGYPSYQGYQGQSSQYEVYGWNRSYL